MNILLAITFALVISCTLVQPHFINNDGTNIMNPYQKEFLEMAHYIEKTHCLFYDEPLQIMSFETYSLLVNKVLRELENIDDDEKYFITINWFLEKMKDGHTRIPKKYSKNANINLWWVDDSLIITSVIGDTSRELLYKKVAKFGHISVQKYEKLINDYIPADIGNNLYKRLFSPDLMVSYAYLDHFNLLDDDNYLVIEYLDGTTTRTRKVAFSNHYPDSYNRIPERCRNNITRRRNGNWYRNIHDYNAMYIQLNSLPSTGYVEFWNELFTNVKNNNSKAIIIDLRNNGGGNSNWCTELLEYLVQRNTKIYMYKGWKSNYPINNIKVTSGIQNIKPIGNGLYFNGKVIILTSARTFSSATFFVVAIKDNKLGVIIGEPAGNSSIRFGYMAEPITLSNSGIKFATTKYVWARALPNSINFNDMYIYPDEYVKISLNDIINNNDRVFEKALEEILK